MPTTTLALLLASLCPAAPAPDQTRQAKDKLDQLAKALPAVIADAWAKNPCSTSGRSIVFRKDLKVHRVRMTGPAEAKVSMRFVHTDTNGEYVMPADVVLRYYDGRWTSVPAAPNAVWDMDYFQRWLAQVIDDAAE